MHIYAKTVQKSEETINNIRKNGYPWDGGQVEERKET